MKQRETSPSQLLASTLGPPVEDALHVARAVRVLAPSLLGPRSARAKVLAAADDVRRESARASLADLPVDRLKDATRERMRLGPLADAGIHTVADVLAHRSLQSVPGIGPAGADRITGAARTLEQTALETTPVRLDHHHPTKAATKLLRRLVAWESTQLASTGGQGPAAAVRSAVRSAAQAARPSSPVPTAAAPLAAGAGLITDFQRVGRAAGDVWADFRIRPADYFAMLSDLGLDTADPEATHGGLPEEIVEAVRALTLRTEHLTASLRGYQNFGARFAVVQRRAIIGDEMGLGKTIEALAVLAHLHAVATAAPRFVVVCPAAVLTNWMREIATRTTLTAWRVHGTERDDAWRGWADGGGVAVTTYEGLSWFEEQEELDVAAVVVDEAHYVKNPEALRSKRTAALLRACDHAVLLTGTPLENRTEEFGELVRYLQPDLVGDLELVTPIEFRRRVAPAYLRRNQEDVLTELPELVEVDEWLPMSEADHKRYLRATLTGNFMAMRQAAMVDPRRTDPDADGAPAAEPADTAADDDARPDATTRPAGVGASTAAPDTEPDASPQLSVKMRRLIEIVEEAEENGRRVIVFSYFRQVLDEVAAALPGPVIGPLTGSVPPAARQDMVDELARATGGAALVAQITAGGVGLNVQAASVVVICEPQLKPTLEWQAIARAHRMGQLETVQVHRLLSETGVDRQIVEMLAEKRQSFDDFARVSDTARSAPEALDVSESDLAQQIVAAEQNAAAAEKSAVP